MARGQPEGTLDLDAAFAAAAAGERVTVRRGRQAAAVVPLADLDRLVRLDAEEDLDDVAAEAALAEGPCRPSEELRRKHGLA